MKAFLIAFIIVIFSQPSFSQTSFCDGASPSIFTANILLESAVEPTLDGMPLPQDISIIAIAEIEGNPQCAGVAEWEGENTFIIVNGNDGSDNGYQNGEDYRFFLQLSNGCIIDSVIVEFETDFVFTNAGYFEDGGLSKISSFQAFSTDWLLLETNNGLCEASSAFINTDLSGFGPYTYQWSNGDTLANISGLEDGVFSLTATDNFGCTLIDSTMVFSIEALSLEVEILSGSSNCESSVLVAGGTPPYTYNWSNGETEMTASDLVSGEFSVTVTDVNNCNNEISENCILNNIDELDYLKKWQVYPNPANQFLNVILDFYEVEEVSISVHNLYGQLIMEKQFRNKHIKWNLDIREFPIGNYVLQVNTGETIVAQKVLISR